MRSFSKRYKSINESDISFDRSRQRIAYYIKSCAESDFFMPCVTMIKTNGDKLLNESRISGFSISELGYDLMGSFDKDEFTFSKPTRDKNGKKVYYYSDKEFADFIEIMIIFCKDEKREEFVTYINNIFQDESSQFLINGWMLIMVKPNDSSSILPLIKDNLLTEKLKPLYSESIKDIDGSTKSRLAADALQLIFSSEQKGKTKAESERIVDKIAERWTDSSHKDEFKTMINDTVKHIKELNNNISNIRHTDRSTIRVSGDSMYDFIASVNIAMINLAIEATQDELIGLENASDIRERFTKTYKIDPIKNELAPVSDDAFDLSEIPF